MDEERNKIKDKPIVSISDTTEVSSSPLTVGAFTGFLVGLNDGPFAIFGEDVGSGSGSDPIGDKVGLKVGVGEIVGAFVGSIVGEDVGAFVGGIDGESDGDLVLKLVSILMGHVMVIVHFHQLVNVTIIVTQ